MQLIYLKLGDYKNLNGLEIKFQENENASVIIGNNGSGKSNIIEAISCIFAGLYLHNPKKVLNDKTKLKPFNYTLHYTVKTNQVKIDYDTKTGWKFSVKQGEAVEVKFKESDFFKREDEMLPSQVIANYSGEESRLFNLFYEPFYQKFTSDFLKLGKLSSVTQKLYFVNKYYWEMALLTLIYRDQTNKQLKTPNKDIENFLTETLGIKKYKKVHFTFNTSKYSKYQKTPTIDLVEKLNPDKVKKVEYSLKELMQKTQGYTDKYFFNLLSTAFLPKREKIISEINIVYNNDLDTLSFSEGEKKLILLQFILEVLADEETLILFDEPDSHIHISRKEIIKTLINKYTSRESVLTTHSPTLTHCFDLKHIISISKDNGKISIDNNSKFEIIDKITGGIWSYQEQNLFYSSKKDILLVEGKHDKTHIATALKQLSEEYPELDFDVYDMKGATNIKQMMIGLANCGQVFKHKIIAVYDNDKEGLSEIKQNFNKDNSPILRLTDKTGNPSTTFYAILLPKPVGSSEDYTIENFYGSDKYEQAYTDALTDTKGFFSNRSIETVAEDIKLKSKNILADNCNAFDKNDFQNFKALFELLKQIKAL